MNPKIAVFSGGISPERDVSIVSGENVANALSKNFEEGVEVKEARGRVMPYGAHTVPAIP